MTTSSFTIRLTKQTARIKPPLSVLELWMLRMRKNPKLKSLFLVLHQKNPPTNYLSELKTKRRSILKVITKRLILQRMQVITIKKLLPVVYRNTKLKLRSKKPNRFFSQTVQTLLTLTQALIIEL